MRFALTTFSLIEPVHREAKEKAEAKEVYMKVRRRIARLAVGSSVDYGPHSFTLRARRSKRRRTSLV